MNLLCFETSSKIGSVSLFKDGKFYSEEKSNYQLKHAEFIHHSLESQLKAANLSLKDIDLFAVGIGPGSFTGIRVSLNIVKTFSYLFKKQIYAENSLKILSFQEGSDPVLVLQNAHKKMVYLSYYENSQEVIAPMAIESHSVEDFLKNKISNNQIIVFGDGYQLIQGNLSEDFNNKLIRKPHFEDYPFSSFLGKRILNGKMNSFDQTLDWKSIIPLYIRRSEAEENLNI